MRRIEVRELGCVPYGQAWNLQRELEGRRKAGEIPDQLLLLEHPHVVTLGRNGRAANLLVSRERLAEMGIEYFEIDRGGDITYHGPGQIIAYPILDLKEWKRDVVAYVRGLEEVIIGTLHQFGIEAWRERGATGVWTSSGKICALGVHIARWVTTHGLALNWTTDLKYYQYIVPCGLARPVTSIEQLGVQVDRAALHRAIVERFVHVFGYEPAPLLASL